MTLEEYKKLLNAHDWFYQMTEDRGVYARGREQYNVLIRHMTDSPEHRAEFAVLKLKHAPKF